MEIESVDQYIEQFSGDTEARLRELRSAVLILAPQAEERISWRMPSYYQGRPLIHFAAFKNHIGLYPGPEAIEAFADELSAYKTSKGAIQFPNSKELPLDLVKKIISYNIDHRK